MKDTLQRILFYLRHEMTEYVRTRIELSMLSCLILLFLGFIGYQAHEWYRLEKEIERHEAIYKAKMEDLIFRIRAGSVNSYSKRLTIKPKKYFYFIEEKPDVESWDIQFDTPSFLCLDGIFLWFPSQNRTFLVRKPYVFGSETVRFWDGERKRKTA